MGRHRELCSILSFHPQLLYTLSVLLGRKGCKPNHTHFVLSVFWLIGVVVSLCTGLRQADIRSCVRTLRVPPQWRGEGENRGLFVCLFVGWLLNIPATCKCISGTDLHRQFYVLPHWDRICRSNFLPHPVTVYWHWANQSQHWPYNARRLAG